jgi:phosphate transport system substrate-binding protein
VWLNNCDNLTHKENTVKKLLISVIAILGFAVQAQTISGAGATFPAPLYAKWADAYSKETGIKINYQSVGSGAGIKQVESKTVAFGASDMPLKDDKLKEMNVTQWPMAIGGVVPVINLKEIPPGQLKLTGSLLADIYLGKIKKWNDVAIAKLNPSLKLPDTDIVPIRRADGSGTTFIFTNYLSKVNADFKQTIGEGTAVNWQVGAGGKGNEGVAQMVKQLAGSIGYVEYAYVKQTKMNYSVVQNREGSWPLPDDDTFKAAAAGADWNKTFYQILTDQPGKNSWPISGATFIIMPLQHHKPDEAKEAIKFFTWALDKGDKMAEDLDYVPMPKSVVPKIKLEMSKIK